jgi:hypothetical protein
LLPQGQMNSGLTPRSTPSWSSWPLLNGLFFGASAANSVEAVPRRASQRWFEAKQRFSRRKAGKRELVLRSLIAFGRRYTTTEIQAALLADTRK